MDGLQSRREWCIVRFSKGKFERVRDGYKSAKNAERGIPFVEKAFIAEGGDRSATYAVGSYLVGNVTVHGTFRRGCA